MSRIFSRPVLHPTLPGTMDTKYHLRPRPHNSMLTAKNRSITECDFITRMVFKDVYWHYAFFIAILCIYMPFFTCIVFYSPLFYHVHRVVTSLRFVNHY